MPLGRCSAIFRSEVSRKGARYLPRCAEALIFHRGYQDRLKNAAGSKWHEHGLVFASTVGTQRNASNVLRSFRAIVRRAGLNEAEWTPREMRHSFVSLLSDSGMPIENSARLVGHAGGSEVTETVYRQQGAEVMDRILARQAKDG